ncbi:MAG: glycosyltransferase [Buchananella hordeovulneris]|nr:glycosyltransferase [Buchananella hordeovulneris]
MAKTLPAANAAASQDTAAAVVDAVIAVHRAERPVARTVASVLDGNQTPCRAIVVAHNIDADLIRTALGKWGNDPRVTLIEHRDGIPSPAGPMNAGFEAARAPFVTLVGSDDTLEAGAVDRWVKMAQDPKNPADFVIANRLEPEGGNAPTPPVRRSRRANLDGVKDRLVYRMSALGLLRRSTLGHLRFPEGTPTGEDTLFATRIWFGGVRVSFAFGPPGYRVHADQDVRITTSARPAGEELQFLSTLLDPAQPWMQRKRQRRALVTKLLRSNVLDTANNQLRSGWTSDAAASLATITRRLLALDPAAAHALSVSEWAVIRALSSGRATGEEIARLQAKRAHLRSLKTVLPARPWALFSAQGPLRYHMAGSRLARERNTQ